jgi:hypothetical protein
MKNGKKKDMKDFTRLAENFEKPWKPVSEELEVINLGIEHEKKELKVDTLVTANERKRLVSLLHKYANIFTWTYIDMSGLDTDIKVHKIPLVEESKPVK